MSPLEWVQMVAGGVLCAGGVVLAGWLRWRTMTFGRRPRLPLRSHLRWFGVMLGSLSVGMFLVITAIT